MRATFFKRFFEHVDAGEPVHLLTADLGFGVLTPYMDRYPDHVTNVGVAEANMIGVAAGMAMLGYRVCCYSMVPFALFRTLDQIRADLCAMRLPVTVVGVGAGLFYGMEGMTHHSLEDLAIARALPGLSVFSPGDPLECHALLDAALANDGPCYLRLGGTGEPVVHAAGTAIAAGRLSPVAAGGDVAIVATGTMLYSARQAVDLLAGRGLPCQLWSAHTLKPLDEETIARLGRECRVVVSVEEHSAINGLGTAVAECLFAAGFAGRFVKIALPDAYAPILGSRDWLRARYRLSAEGIAEQVLSLV